MPAVNHQTPSTPTVSLADDADLAAEAGQRVAVAAQTAQQIFNNWVLYEQRIEERDERGHRQQTGHERADDRRMERQESTSERAGRVDQRQVTRDMAAGPTPLTTAVAQEAPASHPGLRLVTDVDFEAAADPARVESKIRLLDPDGSLAEAASGHSPAAAVRAEQIRGQNAVPDYLVGNRLAAQEDYLIGNQLVTKEDYLQAPNPFAVAGGEAEESPSPDARLTR